MALNLEYQYLQSTVYGVDNGDALYWPKLKVLYFRTVRGTKSRCTNSPAQRLNDPSTSFTQR